MDIITILSLNEQMCDAIINDDKEKLKELKVKLKNLNILKTRQLNE